MGGWFYLRSFLQVYVLQCFLMLVLAASAVVATQSPVDSFNPYLLALGVSIWLLGFYFEVLGDLQLDRHLKDPTQMGRLMQGGLWHYTRHPNYFGEITMWWGLWVITTTLPYWWLALLSPVAITLLIRFVSGVPLLEPMMEKYPEWEQYKARTNMLIPWWPKLSR